MNLSQFEPPELIIGGIIICVLVLIVCEVVKLILEHKEKKDEDTTE